MRESDRNEEKREALRDIVRLGPDERLDRLYLFEPLTRREVDFRLALVTKRDLEGKLEMVAIGERAEGDDRPGPDFVRRARFPEAVLPEILQEFIERSGVEVARFREIRLDPGSGGPAADPVDRLLDLIDAGAA
ncbi:MAG: hypothetical protein R3199_04205 [Gemmatimonadota bacterium]|nr:hypothetical protein [Gemmatimonadota bacterium]